MLATVAEGPVEAGVSAAVRGHIWGTLDSVKRFFEVSAFFLKLSSETADFRHFRRIAWPPPGLNQMLSRRG